MELIANQLPFFDKDMKHVGRKCIACVEHQNKPLNLANQPHMHWSNSWYRRSIVKSIALY